ncbi:MAG: DnaA regulatory inactivator Hda [Halioglobus sp.]
MTAKFDSAKPPSQRLPEDSQKQLTLNVGLRDDATIDNFLLRPALVPMMATLTQQLEPAGEQFVFLHGAADTGKSHLLQASCHRASGGALYLPLADLINFPPEQVLEGVDTLGLVCIDDVHLVAGQQPWEHALFHAFNRARQSDCAWLLAADNAPRNLDITLADLQSRLGWGGVFKLPSLDDAVRIEVLQFRAERRGLTLSREVANYIVSRAPRALSELIAVLDALDKASLAEQRALSIPFVKQCLGW